MGNKETKERQTEKLMVAFTPTQKKVIEREAEKLGMSQATYIRMLALSSSQFQVALDASDMNSDDAG